MFLESTEIIMFHNSWLCTVVVVLADRRCSRGGPELPHRNLVVVEGSSMAGKIPLKINLISAKSTQGAAL